MGSWDSPFTHCGFVCAARPLPPCVGSQDVLTPAQVTEFEVLFREFDTSGEGVIDSRELGVMLRALGMYCTEAEVS